MAQNIKERVLLASSSISSELNGGFRRGFRTGSKAPLSLYKQYKGKLSEKSAEKTSVAHAQDVLELSFKPTAENGVELPLKAWEGLEQTLLDHKSRAELAGNVPFARSTGWKIGAFAGVAIGLMASPLFGLMHLMKSAYYATHPLVEKNYFASLELLHSTLVQATERVESSLKRRTASEGRRTAAHVEILANEGF